MESVVKQRLIAFISYLGLSKNAFEVACGLSKRYVSNISVSISPSVIEKISLKFPQLNKSWLLTGEGEMLKSATPSVQQLNTYGNNNYNTGVMQIGSAPVECAEVECPNCGEVIEVASSAVIPLVPPEIAKKPDLNLESFRHNCTQQMEEVDLRQVWGIGVFLMKVDTRAMEPEYREGTFLVLRRLKDLSYARPDGSAYVIDTMRPHTLFRYLSKERDGTYVLSAESDKRGPIYLNAEDIINIYDVVGSFRIGR